MISADQDLAFGWLLLGAAVELALGFWILREELRPR